MKLLNLLLIALVVSSCAVKRTRDSDKTLRVAVDQTGMEPADSMSLKNALMESGKFYVVDRGQAFSSIKAEQESEHVSNSDRFEDTQKYAHWGKLYGVGGVIVTHHVCKGAQSSKNLIYLTAHLATLGMFDKTLCNQFIELVDTNTGEIVATATNEAGRGAGEVLDWSDIVDKLVENYPKYFESDKRHKKLIEYEAESAALAKQRNASEQ